MMSRSASSVMKKVALFSTVGASLYLTWRSWIYFRERKLEKNKPRLKDASSYIKEKSVIIITSTEQWESVYPRLVEDLKNIKILGLDCEWVGKNRVALLQLCSPYGLCVLIRLSVMEPPFPDTLLSLLADKSVLKTGVAVVNDGMKLQSGYGFSVSGCVDLQHLLPRVNGVFQCQSTGLKGLAQGILFVEISKDHSIRCGDWEAHRYSQSQIDYAATDAAVAVDIFLKLATTKMAQSKLHRDEGEEPHSDGSLQTGRTKAADEDDELWRVCRMLCQGIVDVGYTSSSKVGNQTGGPLSSKKKVKDGKEIYSTRQRPLWDNCRLLAPDGTSLCTCDRKKAQWYLDKELADKVCDDPITVKLRFEPSNRPESDRNYYLQDKENQCVVCGADKDYIRKFVIPFEYKKFFPSALKDHSSHDVLLLCTSCHRESCDHDSMMRQRLGLECDAPVESGSFAKTVIDQELQKVRSAGRALKTNLHTMPPKRIIELEKHLIDYYGVDYVSDDLMERAADIDPRQTADNYIPHGKKVVRHMVMNGGLLAFQARWRQHFLDTMKPQFLPAFWSVDYVPDGWTKLGNS